MTNRAPATSKPWLSIIIPAIIVTIALTALAALGRWYDIKNIDEIARIHQATMQGPLLFGLFAIMIPFLVLIIYGAQLGSTVAIARVRADATRDIPKSWWASVAGALGTVLLVLLAVVVTAVVLGMIVADQLFVQHYPLGYPNGSFATMMYLGIMTLWFVIGAVAALPSTVIATMIARNRLGISAKYEDARRGELS